MLQSRHRAAVIIPRPDLPVATLATLAADTSGRYGLSPADAIAELARRAERGDYLMRTLDSVARHVAQFRAADPCSERIARALRALLTVAAKE